MTTFGDPAHWPDDDLVGWSDEIHPDMVVEAYANGVFPMPLEDAMGWWSPVRRGVLPLDGLKVPRSLRKSAKRYRITVDTAFDRVIARCGDRSRDGFWIDDTIRELYAALHRAGIVHSVEAWDAEDRLVGGLYGVALGGLFAGESMFHDPEHGRDASKGALIGLVAILRAAGSEDQRLLDVQWRTDHLASLGVVEVPRPAYLWRLERALELPAPDWGAVPD
ncbi:leucyl/phenylalanyl-tRNA--protein transferase [Mariniluteicoccus flavus]